MEDITNEFQRVGKVLCYFRQAGEISCNGSTRNKVTDTDMVLLARDISKQIEAELQRIIRVRLKVNVIPESRAVDYSEVIFPGT